MDTEKPATPSSNVPIQPVLPAPPPETGTKKSKRKLLIIITVMVLIIAAIITGWLLKKSSNSSPPLSDKAYSGPVENIKIGNVGEYSIFNLIAKDKGYFTKYGLNAEIKEYASGPPAVTDLLGDKVDFAIAADFVGVNNIFSHNDLRILTQVSDQKAFSLVALKDKGITKPADLKGKKIGVTKKGAGEFFLLRFLSLNGLNTSDITVLDEAPPDMVSQITNSQIDAVVIFDPHVYNLQKTLADKVVVWSVQGNLRTAALSYSTVDYIQAHHEIVNRYLSALLEAETFLRHNDKESRSILAKSLKYDSAYVDHIWPNINFEIGLHQELLLAMEDEARFVIENKGTNQTQVPNYLDFIYFDGLEKIKPDAADIIH